MLECGLSWLSFSSSLRVKVGPAPAGPGAVDGIRLADERLPAVGADVLDRGDADVRHQCESLIGTQTLVALYNHPRPMLDLLASRSLRAVLASS